MNTETAVETFKTEAAKLPLNACGKVDGRKTGAIVNKLVRTIYKEGGDYVEAKTALWKAEFEILSR